jgi:hypothetical protein
MTESGGGFGDLFDVMRSGVELGFGRKSYWSY